MTALYLISIIFLTSPLNCPEKQPSQGQVIVPIICNSNCNIYLQPRCPRSIRQHQYGSMNSIKAPMVPNSIKLLKKTIPGIEATAHTTTLFSTAETVQKGHMYYDYQFLGMYSGAQWGVSENLELGVKVVIPLLIGTVYENDLQETLLKYGVHLSAKYRIFKSKHLHLAIKASIPVPTGELIGTVKFGNFSLTGALGILAPLQADEFVTWARATARLNLSTNFQLFYEFSKFNFHEGDDVLSSLIMGVFALRRISGKYNYDIGIGTVRSDESNDSMAFPIAYINIGYSI
jgi:hypothetical protein